MKYNSCPISDKNCKCRPENRNCDRCSRMREHLSRRINKITDMLESDNNLIGVINE